MDSFILQVRRGTQIALEQKLVGEAKPKQGELIFELPTPDHPAGRLKVGNGLDNYSQLQYIPDSVELNTVLASVNTSKTEAIHAAADAYEYAGKAEAAKNVAIETANTVKDIPQVTTEQVENYMSKKLHFMTIEEYNALEKIDTDGFYFLTTQD